MKEKKFTKLEARLVEKQVDKAVLASKMGMSYQTLATKLAGKADFKLREVQIAMQVLDIQPTEMAYYFLY